MTMYKNTFKILTGGVLLVLFSFISCKKQGVTISPLQAHFAEESGGYYVENSTSTVFKVPVGLTTPTTQDRTFNFTVSSPTGAAAGAQYNIASNSVTIPAGSAIGYIDVNGIFAGYATDRKDTLVLTLTGGDATIASFSNTFTLAMQKYCPVDLNDLLGVYNNSFDIQPPSPNYGPYPTAISDVESTGATSGKITIENFWDVGGSITVNLDWSDPSNFTTNIPSQFLYNDSRYGAATISPVGKGKFSSCDKSFTFSYTVTVAAGSFGNFTTTIKL